MIELPDLLLSYGIALKKTGNEFTCLCYAHDDSNPSMSVYINGNNNWNAHCHACGAGGSVIKVYCDLAGLDFDNKQDVATAYKALETGEYHSGKPFAVIHNETPLPKEKPERTMLVPPKDTPQPKMGWLEKDGVKWGEPHEVHIYRQPNGDPWFYEARWNLVNPETGEIKKECRCFSWGKRGVSAPAKWECSHHLPPRPLYGLDQVAAKPDAQVVVCEGPRKASAAQTLLPMVACVGWAGGANGWHKSDWSPLSGKACILWPDADDVGRAAMDELANHLLAIGCQVNMLATLDMPDGWDAADALADGWNTDKTLAWAKAAKSDPIEPKEEKKTLEEIDDPADASIYNMEELPEEPEIPEIPQHVVETLPLETYADGTAEFTWTTEPADLFSEFVVPALQHGVLPKVIEDHVFDIAEVINADPSFGAITAVATVAGLIDDRIKIHLNHGYRESARLWTVCVGEPSTKKSPIMDAIRLPLGAIKKRYAQEEQKIKQRQDILDARYKAKIKEYTEACIKSDDHGLVEPFPCERLQRRRIECDNLTREMFEEVLRDMPTGLIIHADELAGWLGSMDAYKAAGVKADRALWLRAYNGGPMQIDKVQRGSYLIENWSATITGGIQPSKLSGMVSQLDDDGLLQRFLIVCSSRDGGQGLARPWNHSASEAWSNLLNHVVEIKPGGELVKLTQEAAEIRDKAVDYIYKIINSRLIRGAFCTALGKWEGTTGRMILIFHVVECAMNGKHPEAELVKPETAQLAIDYMMRHLLPHMVSFYEDGLGESESTIVAKLIAGQIVAENTVELTTTKLHKSGPKKWRSGTTGIQHDSLNRLVEYGWLAPAGGINNATRRPTRFLVNPHVHSLYAKHADSERKRIEANIAIAAKIRAGNRWSD